MNGVQIEHILDLVEEKSAFNRLVVRREVAAYLAKNVGSVVEQLARYGETNIPTSYGAVKLTTEDLTLTAA